MPTYRRTLAKDLNLEGKLKSLGSKPPGKKAKGTKKPKNNKGAPAGKARKKASSNTAQDATEPEAPAKKSRKRRA